MLESGFQDRKREQRIIATRSAIAALLVMLALALLVVRLLHLQVERHDHFSVLSQDNRVKIQPIPPTRGLIYDANGVLLAENHPSFSLEITIEKVTDLDATIAALSRIIPIDDKDRARFARLKRQRMRFQGVPIRLNLTPAEVARFSVNGHRFPGVDVRAELVRAYPLGPYTAHVLGYVGRINERELKRIDARNYAGTHFIGKGGIEKAHEDLLHGQVGHQQVEVNARGRVLRTLESQPPLPGRDLSLYLDINLQRATTDILGDRRGAIVAIDPRNGGVLALVSQPSFDPNLFVEGISQKDYHALLYSPDKPLFNRAIRGQYPPGSTVKPFVGLAGLIEGTVTAQSKAYCPGYFTLPGHSHRFRCWRRGGHGHVDLRAAMAESCDVYFYDLAHKLGIDRLHARLSEFGFGAVTGIDLAGELGGLLPSREWKQRVRNQPWFPGETVIMGIGQGAYLATPLQLAAATATLANHGHFIAPRVVRASRASEPATLTPEEALPIVDHQIQVENPAHWDTVIDSMVAVIEDRHGTARKIRSPDYRIAGKTGTAQVFTIGQSERYDAETVPERLKDHALFVAFAPVEDPRIAVAVVVENGGSGSATAAPIARRVIDAYLGGEPLPPEEEEKRADGD
ncbi:penicillin-binding protein 2 [Marichromatium gracile]|uniref:Peptidoglycan D,D-transpeptidase MrdA n=1 Tax=Marichromatium gracile TaxID=1048 RepID=A0ABR5VGU7_MARGR|nr:penicillin-binding protein 2 [Marichromatium gracile]KXX64580.1 penicillin-binding protein 2 [Marichromatium gracile]